MRRARCWIAGLAVAAFAASAAVAEPRMRIATGGSTGIYYAFASAICKLFDREPGNSGITCDPRPTQGTIFNIIGLWVKEYELAILQPDWARFAYRGEERYRDFGAFEDMRMLFAGVPEMITVLTREPHAIDDFGKLFGKRLNIGPMGSGTRASLEFAMDLLGDDRALFDNATTINAAVQASALCTDRIDALIYIVAHPNPAIREATSNCPSFLVPLTGADTDFLIESFPFYERAIIPGGLYDGNPDPVPTIGMRPIVAVRADMPEEQAYTITRSFFERFEEIRVEHLSFVDLRKEEMVPGEPVVPYHPGARRYLVEAGLLRSMDTAPQ